MNSIALFTILLTITHLTYSAREDVRGSPFTGILRNDSLKTDVRADCEPKYYLNLGLIDPVRDCFSPFLGGCQVPGELEDINTTFTFFGKSDQIRGVPVDYNMRNVDLVRVPFTVDAKTIFLAHGFNGDLIFAHEIRDLYMTKFQTDINVIVVDWTGGASLVNYQKVVANSKVVGRQIARLARKLSRLYGLTNEQLIFIGHSLGAHVFSEPCRILNKNREGSKVAHVIGLDPAGPCFDRTDPGAEQGIGPNDAELVEIIHTDGGTVGFGESDRIGSVDYYPNGGERQPGCIIRARPAVRQFDASGGLVGRDPRACSHSRAHQYFRTDHEQFGICEPVAYECRSFEYFEDGQCGSCYNNGCSLMALGIQVKNGPIDLPSWEGNTKEMYVITSDKEPFCVHHFQVIVNVRVGTDIQMDQSIEMDLIYDGGHFEVKVKKQDINEFRALLTIPMKEEDDVITFRTPPKFNNVTLETGTIGDDILSIRVKYLSSMKASVRLIYSRDFPDFTSFPDL